ncbi:MAG: ABC transporter substrate-binding protein [Acetobacteraceae bacterium]
MNWKPLVYAAATMAVGLGAARASAPTPIPITIGIQTDADWLTIEAKTQHLFEKVGLRPSYIRFTAGAVMMAAAESKSIDVATPGFVPFLAGVGNGIPWVAIGLDTVGPRGEGFVARKGSGIHSIADLRGKRIGYFRASTSQYGLFMGLQKYHVPLSSVTLLSMAPSQQVAAMRSGNIQAAEVWEPWMHTMVADADGKIIATEADIGVPTAASVYAVRRHWLATHQEAARRFMRAIVLAYKEVEKNPQPVIQVFASETGIKKSWSAAIYREAGPPNVYKWADPDYAYSLAPGKGLQQILDKLAAFLFQQKIVPHPIDTANIIDDSVIASAIKELETGK